METDQKTEESCRLCNGTKCLSQKGIVHTYLLPCKISILTIIFGLVLGIVHSGYWFFLALFGYVLPLANADLRLLLYPYVALSQLCGRKVNCSKCEPYGAIFRHD